MDREKCQEDIPNDEKLYATLTEKVPWAFAMLAKKGVMISSLTQEIKFLDLAEVLISIRKT